jgi:hypothetical protein
VVWILALRVELAAVPVVGGSAAQRDAVRAEMSAFDRAVGRGRVRVRHVRFRAMDDQPSFAGIYRADGVIALRESLPRGG